MSILSYFPTTSYRPISMSLMLDRNTIKKPISMKLMLDRNTIDRNSEIVNDLCDVDNVKSVNIYNRVYTNTIKTKRRWKRLIP